MSNDESSLDRLSRDELIERARSHGVLKPEVMTRVELRDEILRLTEQDVDRRRQARGWLGIARDLVASIVDQGLHLPEAAALIRGDVRMTQVRMPAPVATVTLAEIYAAQGHVDRALRMLDEVLAKEPEHEAARHLKERVLKDAERERAAAAEPQRSGAPSPVDRETAAEPPQPQSAEPPSPQAPAAAPS